MKTYFKICFLSPLWLPALLTGVWALFEYLDFGGMRAFPDWLAGFGFVLFFSVCVGGIQYLVAMLIVWRLVDFGSTVSFIQWSLLLPVIFVPLQLLGWCLFVWEQSDVLENLLAFAGIDLLFGYAYVFVWFIGLGVSAFYRKWMAREQSGAL